MAVFWITVIMTAAASASETSVTNRIDGATSKIQLIFIPVAVRT
jgi:hypothetical protein